MLLFEVAESSMEHLVRVAISINKHAKTIVLRESIDHPDKGCDSCPKTNYYVIFPHLLGCDIAWQYSAGSCCS